MKNYDKLKIGDKLTIDGLGYSSKGKLVMDGKLWGTNRKCKAVRPAVYTVTKILDGEINPPIAINAKTSPDLAG